MSAILSGPLSAETLTDTLRDAYRNSNLLEQNRAVLRAADEDVAQAMASLRPTLDFVASSNRTFPQDPAQRLAGVPPVITTAQLQASITLYAGNRNRLAVESTKETVLSTREALRSIEQNVLLAAVQAYQDVRSAESFVQLRQNNNRLITQELNAARDRFEVGEVTRTDVALAESALAEARSLLTSAQGDLATAREAFKLAVGRFPGDLADPPPPPALPATEAEAREIAVRTHPAILQAQRQVTVAEIGIEIAEGAYMPTVTGSITGSTDSYQQDEERTASLNYSQPIYRGGQLASLERQAAARRDQARSSLLRTVREVEQSVGNAWAQRAVTAGLVDASRRQIVAAQTAFDGIREEARLGARTTLDVLDAEQDLLNARVVLVDAQAQGYVANFSLLSAMGLLTAEHLELGVQTYDPAAYYNAVRDAPAYLSPRGQKLDKVLERLGRQ
ncbi:TolC family outer membrane protein [Roseicyclus sp. F158]|uniref:TolC family outer membrane protein n=1 Tax=Tropicimonas omnivorans TaxID=3075590 RepID=A0ABU3DHV1_9RHOB|nr:TolC family outer membrane protein [Roseicyclus sp. F158]MDT0683296.1 TolC family outer membrane protein [Roseicyclus sp. F158]